MVNEKNLNVCLSITYNRKANAIIVFSDTDNVYINDSNNLFDRTVHQRQYSLLMKMENVSSVCSDISVHRAVKINGPQLTQSAPQPPKKSSDANKKKKNTSTIYRPWQYIVNHKT